MRLNKEMKEKLINIILNQLKPAFTEVEAQEKLQQAFNEDIGEELVKAISLIRKYNETSPWVLRSSVYAHNGISPLTVGIYTTGLEIRNYPFFKEQNEDGIYTSKIKKAIEELRVQGEELHKLTSDLKATIMSCTTDKQLADMYPEFVQYFNKAGIVVKAQKHLPAKLGLPEGLVKYGLKLEPESSTVQEELEQIHGKH